MELSTGKILEKNLVQSDFHRKIVDQFTFQQENNLKHKAKSTMELFTQTAFKIDQLDRAWQ